MTYYINLVKMLFNMDDHLFRIQKAEKLKNVWKISALLLLFSVLIYAWSAYLGIGTDIISGNATDWGASEYERSKLWFVVGRMLFAIVFTILLLFIPSLIYYAITGIPYQKLIIMQQLVILAMLVERIVWIPLMLWWGLDWYVSPLSFGIIASYFTDASWLIYFFGAISLFQLGIIWFQVKYLSSLSAVKKNWIWVSVIFLHIVYWIVVSGLAFVDVYLISGWFE
ncbi:hypothetical protein [Virgibacillus oceani]|uniref:Yip1 domain-containing protein n=1 Tax=Virgibacillus oceani TaxID=1479511 RepID=A0A917M8F7_9BACI|nr:hypothetical protein [Virgibacillus oceani]GGG84275.1 hypothetical protein GCM10011398_32380 [Virgibacillus oceani]